MTYPEAVAPSDTGTLLSRMKLLVEVKDFIDAVLANLALKLFILFRINQSFPNVKYAFTQKELGRECAQ